MANILQILGLQSPGIGVVPDGNTYGSAPTPAPTNLLDGISGYGAPTPAPLATPDAPITQPQTAANLLQSLNVGAPANAVPAVQPSDVAGTRPARARSSVVDTIGRVADVLANVGGANPLYQPTLDARQDREIALGDHDRAVAMEKIKLASAQGTLGDENNARLGNAVRGLQAITQANPQADISKVWPLLAAQAGIDPQRAQALGAEFAANPDIIKGIAGTVGATKEFGLQPFYYTDSEGKLQAAQISKDGTFQKIDLDGGQASDPTKAVNLGGTTALVGTRSGKVNTTLTNTLKPDTVANNTTKENIARGNNSTAVTVANIHANAPKNGAKATGNPVANAQAGLTLIDNIQKGFNDLHGMGALAGEGGGAIGNVIGALGRTPTGQALGAQFGNAAAQKRISVEKNIRLLQQDLIKSLPASAVRTKFEQEIVNKSLPDPMTMDYNTANGVLAEYRAMYQKAARDAAAEVAAKANGGRVLPPRLGAPSPAPTRRPAPRTSKPTVSNW